MAKMTVPGYPMHRALRLALLSILLLAGCVKTTDQDVDNPFIKLLSVQSLDELNSTLSDIETGWRPGHVPMALEIMSLTPAVLREPLLRLLQNKTGQTFGDDVDDWFIWWWRQDTATTPDYAEFKAQLYARIDARFRGYFAPDRATSIRLDEVRWGGVRQDGIPPLRQPAMVTMDQADYLDDENIVFGIEINGDARAYPKRILAWHEMFVDRIGGVDYVGVYCTLCGAVILYEARHQGTLYQLGTSGFLYRSNKLMYDRATQSLWNTTWGEPVIGPLVGKNIRLQRSYLVTTTWGEWRRRHPDTTVLSLDTGFSRNYDEGEAYRDYFATDDLMFSIATSDNRLQNKSEVLALLLPKHAPQPLAIAAELLRRQPVFTERLGTQPFVVLTDTTGANRVYDSAGIHFVAYDGNATATDSKGARWRLGEAALSAPDGRSLARLPAHRAFWFGWHAAYPDTRLIK